MKHDLYDKSLIRDVLKSTRTIAVVGASANPSRPSYGVMRFLLSKGYHVIPVNPGHAGHEIHGQKVVGKLSDIDEPIDMVDVFRAADQLPNVIDEVLALPKLPKVIWGQLTVRHDGAAEKAEEKGITVIMDRCPAIEYPRVMAA
jgi:predicted CoA-binding protein